MKNKQRLDFGLKIKSINEAGEFSGYGSIFGNKDSYSDIVIKGAFAKSLASWAEKGLLPAMLWQHDVREPIGVYTKMEEDENGLYVEGRLLIEDDQLARRAHAHLKAGSISGMSIGYDLIDLEFSSAQDAYLLKEIDLWEVSLVTFPANDQARVDNVKSILGVGDIPSPSKVERVLRDAGFSRKQAKGIMSKGYSGLNQRDVDGGVELKSMTDAMQSVLKAM
jgi:hypothetical protein